MMRSQGAAAVLLSGVLLFLGVQDAAAQTAPQDETAVLEAVTAPQPDSLGLPLYPGAREISGSAQREGSFTIASWTFRTDASYAKVVRFYRKRLPRQTEVREWTEETRRKKAHFFSAGETESKNIVVEEAPEGVKIVMTVFSGGGGRPGE